ncbi:amidohydrolase [Pseudoalteromonas denitrificans]|uniref:Amidohydrolase 3 domain-containing protein n=1 Tax=Pseudoalteromonas denitrificans DSM 6059 TaxID=1123010 RepID=A0A1I1E6B1_9GAMM|nr:amidohydrolase [Pseudoalteromonas denitrificans]SFB82739.1 hypothetical protein SAMN02745724_00247 [Pseudoalteromonas denitrificans DSM 6059]
MHLSIKIIFCLTLIIPPVVSAKFTLIHNVTGYTLERTGNLKQFSTLVFKDGKIVKTGDKSLLKNYPKAHKINGNNKYLLPGLIDAHGHVIGLGQNLSRLDLRNTKSKQEIGEKLKVFAKDKTGWIIGRGWDQENWPVQQFPTASDLDIYIKDMPVVLTRVDGHAIWANTKAMSLASISSSTLAPNGGEIMRLDNNNPSGVFIDKAENLINEHIPKSTKNEINHALNLAGEHLLSLGITSVHDAGIDLTTWQVYKQRSKNKSLPFRIYAMLSASDPSLEKMLNAGTYQEQNDFLSIRSIKVYADGALGSRGAALLEDYADRPQHKGLMLESQNQLEKLYTQSFKHGFTANTHAIGDRANKTVLDAYESVFKKTGGRLLRNRIEHAQIVHIDDIPRFKKLNIIPSMQPVHATSDMHMAPIRLDDKRLVGAYAWQTFIKQGSHLAAGSDFPVELANVFHGFYSAVSRMDQNQQPEKGWFYEQALSRKQAFKAFTLDGAYAAHQEFKIGSLERGKWADFILVDQDIFKAPVSQIYKTQVLETWIAGEKKYQKRISN